MSDTAAAATPAATPDATTTPQATDAAPQPIEQASAEAIRKHKVKIDGQELEVDEPELLKSYERSKASYKRFEEAARLKREVEARERELTETLQLLRSPKHRVEAIARLLGGEDALADMATDVLMKRMEWESLPEPERRRRSEMTEREKRIEEEERRLAAREEAARKKRDAEVAAEAERMQQEWMRTWPDILKKAGAPPSRGAIARMAGVMKEALEIGVDLTPQEAAQRVAEEIREEMRAIASDADPEQLRTLLGPGADKIRAAEVATARAQPGRIPPKEQPPQRREAQRQPQLVTTEYLRKKLLSR